MPGDMGDDFRAMQSDRQERHARWKKQNMEVLEASGLTYRATNFGETILFREEGQLKVDFYPSTGRWRVAGQRDAKRGGARAFIAWYNRTKNGGKP